MSKSRYAWVLVGILWFIWMLNYIDRQIIYSVFPLLRTDLKLSDFQLGLLSTSFLWVYALVSPMAGYLGDRFSRKKVIIASLSIWSLVTLGTGLTRSFPQLVMALGLMGVSEAAYLPAGLALIADYHSERTRSLATGLHMSGSYFGMVMGGVVGGWIGQRYGWRPAFTILGFIGIAYALLASLVLRDSALEPEHESHNRAQVQKPRFAASFREVVSLRAFPTLTMVFVVMSMANWLMYAWMPLYLYERFHMSLLGAGFSATFYLQAGSVGGMLLGGMLTDRWRARSPRGRLLAQGVSLAFAAPFLCLAGMTTSAGLLLAALVIYGIGRGGYECNVMPVLCEIAPPELRATGYGLFNCAGTVAGGVFAAAAGALKSTVGIGGMMQVAGCLFLVAAVFLFRLELPYFGGVTAALQGEST
jgi:MFS transporter, Spinster family, sphingosine-1-phosphate transporter